MPIDGLADHITALADDVIQNDDTKNLLVALQRARKHCCSVWRVMLTAAPSPLKTFMECWERLGMHSSTIICATVGTLYRAAHTRPAPVARVLKQMDCTHIFR